MSKGLFGVIAAICWVVATTSGSRADGGDHYQWVQYVPGGIEVRAITPAETCPSVTFDGATKVMDTRAAAGDLYQIHVCAAPVPPGTKQASIDGVPLPLPVAHPNRILIVGDTGCRLKDQHIQACNDLSEWPFRLGATMSATFRPDVVLHVGDFHYRESGCPLGNQGCGGSPYGDRWEVWRADFFAPAESLLQAAPWVLVRGNHEECDRGGKGWARTLDPYPFKSGEGVSGCLGPAKPFTVDLDGVTLEIMDVSTADEDVNDAQVAWFKEQFALPKAIPGPVWQVFHRPVWAVDAPEGKKKRGDNKTLEAAAFGTVPANVQAFVSGHHHTFEVMSYDQDLPVQIVSGHGGDDLSPWAPKTVRGIAFDGVSVKDGIGRPGVYGFSMIERAPGDNSGTWTLTAYDTHGRPFGSCKIVGRSADCQ